MSNTPTLNGAADMTFINDEGHITAALGMLIEVAQTETKNAPRGSVPTTLIDRYVRNAMLRARTELLEDGSTYAYVPAINGAWGQGPDAESAKADLKSAIEDWLELKIADQDGDIPKLNGIDLNKIVPA